LSKSIRALEQLLGVKLFERTTRGAVPTLAGKPFLETARRIITDVDNLKTTARAARYGELGRIVVGFSSSISIGHLKMALGDYLERFPDVQLDGVEAGSERLLGGLQGKIIDIAIHAGDLTDVSVAKRALWSERLMLALPEDHALAGNETVYWTDLRKEVFVVPSTCGGPVLAELLTNRLMAEGFKPNIIAQEAAQENILGLVAFGKFITVVGESALGVTRPGLVFKDIHDRSGHARLDYAAYWRHDNDNPALKRFFKLIDERYPVFGTG
jgi:DNA-binding transcriptional LysR family regulator